MEECFCDFSQDFHAIWKMAVTETTIKHAEGFIIDKIAQSTKDTIAFGKLHRNVFCMVRPVQFFFKYSPRYLTESTLLIRLSTQKDKLRAKFVVLLLSIKLVLE